MLRLSGPILAALLLTGCGGSADALLAEPEAPEASVAVEVLLWHCGIEPITVAGRIWEVPRPPFDATNAPATFSGRGAAVVVADALQYTDDAGALLLFEPDDGIPPPVCA